MYVPYELLSRSNIGIKGKKAVVVGRSNVVGLPVSLLLLKEDATVTIVHSHTEEPEKIIQEADIVIAAARQANMTTYVCAFILGGKLDASGSTKEAFLERSFPVSIFLLLKTITRSSRLHFQCSVFRCRLTRLALCDEGKLEDFLFKLLPITILALSSSSKLVRNKLMSFVERSILC